MKASSDKTIYDPLEVGHALTDDIIPQIMICAERHKHIFDEEEYFVCLFIAYDPLITTLRRHKYAAFLHMPSPRPQQVCFLYNKITNKLTRLWSMPDARVMAIISEKPFVDKSWRKTKGWVDAFFKGQFWAYIRKESNISHLSEIEYLKTNRQKLIDSGAKEGAPSRPEAFDFSKIHIDHIIDTKTAHTD